MKKKTRTLYCARKIEEKTRTLYCTSQEDWRKWLKSPFALFSSLPSLSGFYNFLLSLHTSSFSVLSFMFYYLHKEVFKTHYWSVATLFLVTIVALNCYNIVHATHATHAMHRTHATNKLTEQLKFQEKYDDMIVIIALWKYVKALILQCNEWTQQYSHDRAHPGPQNVLTSFLFKCASIHVLFMVFFWGNW